MKLSGKISYFYILRKAFPPIFSCCPVYYIVNLGVSIIHALSYVVVLYATQHLFDTVVNLANGSTSYFNAIVALLLAASSVLLQQFLNGIDNYQSNILYSRMKGFYRKIASEKAARLEPISFEDPNVLDYINKSLAGADAIFAAVNSIPNILAFYVPYFIFISIHLFNLEPLLVLAIVFIFAPKAISLVVAKTPIYSKLSNEVTPLYRESRFYEQSMTDKAFLKETRILGAHNYFKGLYRDVIRRLNNRQWRADKKSIAIDISMSLLSLASYFGVLLLLFNSLMRGNISTGAFAAVMASIISIIGIMDEVICRNFGSLSKTIGVIKDFVRFLDLPERKGSKAASICTSNNDITFTDVGFRYPNVDFDSLRNINLVIRHGETIAIVGVNGSGKTTLAKLIAGLYLPTRGAVTINNTDITDIPAEELFKNKSGIFQKYKKYQMTLGENIKISQTDCSQNEQHLKRVFEQAGISVDESNFANGLDTMLSREFDGTDLSEGQWQRVALARGFYRTNNFLIFDEPTSAIDPIEENNIYQKISEVSKDTTIIIITHKMASAKIADRIIVVDQGTIIENGCHDYLLSIGGAYADMYNSQASWYIRPLA